MQRFALLAAFAALLFGAAGDAGWTRGWAYVGTAAVVEASTLGMLAVGAPVVLRVRRLRMDGVPAFDKVFAAMWLVIGLGSAVVAGLDVRRSGQAPLPWIAFLPGALFFVHAAGLGVWAMLANGHFEQFVRIQSDRGHRVVSSGPYAVVRHPGYLAAILGVLAAPLMLGSLWTLVPAGLMAGVLVVRTRLEDGFLQRNLDGYAAYAEATRYRLLPFVW